MRDYDGQLVAAAGGTVFLDEVDDTPLPFQVKLLRVLEDRVVSRLGENERREVDFRILAATNRDLAPLFASGSFGADLYERLAIVAIRLPPLRERSRTCRRWSATSSRRFYRGAGAKRRTGRGVPTAALAALGAYRWPGNIRELRNVIFEALVQQARRRRAAALGPAPAGAARRGGRGRGARRGRSIRRRSNAW